MIRTASIPSDRTARQRPGAAFLIVLVALALVGIAMSTAAWRMTASRRFLDRRHQELQAQWLARAAIEMAAARLLSDPGQYTGETVELVANSTVRIRVAPTATAPDRYRVISDALYPKDAHDPVRYSVECEVKRIPHAGKIELVVQRIPSE